ncbi:uroporphyrinogen-III C-methyltransferase [Rhodoblastus sphagnicola]|uniref:uroporphyrinogen-III C-methyltransferase n=1 Tax=Rhodoblastus sphagnicola TaxID=333368 RepID=A0A2S6N917_9HYPH|nr:uroporphyrinogen-III C-methyltransferase [Rhodoblastus sphagnicola]MBB4196865.1 uroporphyrin-III C-methyltransferase [Rhodoblastus sphagnicola]PPQ31087.1 uroporphyrinogen-III C-methyltransferase [Rhodoblastus sphagnicola]
MNARPSLPLASNLPTFEPGQVWLVGAGAGDPGLLTLLALHALQHADVIVHDALVSDEILALARPQARREFAGKRGGHPSAHQDDITESLIDLARQNLRVVRLKGGDPFVFGRGGEEAAQLAAAGINFRIVPGVTSGLAGLAYAGIPATTRGANRGVILATGHSCAKDEESLDWRQLAQTGLPIILYMAIKRLDVIVGELLDGGADPQTPVAIVEEATTPRQRTLVTTLENCTRDAKTHGCAAPAIIAIGAIVNLREHLQDFLLNAGTQA